MLGLTVAITRARAFCLIMGPLDMKGLLGADTVMGTLMYGAGHVWAGHAHFYLHDYELSRSLPDESFIDMLKQNCCLSGPHFPPPAMRRSCKIMSLITRYVAYVSLLLTCGGHGSIILPEPERLLTNFGVFLIVMTHVV